MNHLKTDGGAVFFRLTVSAPYRRLLALARLVLMALPGASLAQENHAPGTPGPIQVSEVTAHSARISWGAATDLDGDAIAYWVSVRKRTEGIAQPWSAARFENRMSRSTPGPYKTWSQVRPSFVAWLSALVSQRH